MRTFLSLEEAWEETLATTGVLGTEEVALEDSFGRFLGKKVTARAPFPAFDRSALDGYAVRAADLEQVPVTLEVLEVIGAGQVPTQVVGPRQATRIMTGAPIPAGADAIVRLEATERVDTPAKAFLSIEDRHACCGEVRADRQEAQTDQQKARTDQQEAQTAQQEAQTAQQGAQTVQQEARTAQQEAQTAQQKARTDQQEARTDQQEARTDRQEAQTAQQEAQTAQQEAQTARQVGQPTLKRGQTVGCGSASDGLSESQVRILISVAAGEAISRRGEDVTQESLLLEAGCRIGGAEMAVLGANGERRVTVYRRPRVGVIVSGAEVRPAGDSLQTGQVHDSNAPMLAGLIREQGGLPILYGIVGDDLEATAQLVKQAAAECDLLLTTGGVSVGDYDLMRDAYAQAGGEVLFWKVSIRPGTPVTYARIADTPVFGLSGNPAAAFINFVLLVQPVLRKLAGHADPEHRPIQARLHSDTETRVIGLDRFLRATLTLQDSILTAVLPNHSQKAGILTTLPATEALIRIPGGTTLTHGQLVEVYPLHSGAKYI